MRFLLASIFLVFSFSGQQVSAQIYYNFAWDEEDLAELLPFKDTITVMQFGRYSFRPYRTDSELIPFPDTLLKFDKLEALSFGSHTDIIRLDSGIANLSRLKKLEMTLHELGPEISYLQSLEYLVLYGVRSPVPEEFSRLKKLEYLFISADSVSEFPRQLYKLENMKTLQISMDGIDKLPSGISALKDLKELHIYCRSLKSLPDDLTELNKLEKVVLGMSKDSGSGKELNKILACPNLQDLEIDYPYLKTFPKGIGHLKSLNRLKFTIGKEDSLSGLTRNDHLPNLNLKILEIDVPYVYDVGYPLPEFIGKIKNLEKLVVNGKTDKNLPEWLSELHALKEVTFTDHYHWTEIEKEAMQERFPGMDFKYGNDYGISEKSREENEKLLFIPAMSPGDTLEITYSTGWIQPDFDKIFIVRHAEGYEAIEELIETFNYKQTGWRHYSLSEDDLRFLKRMDALKHIEPKRPKKSLFRRRKPISRFWYRGPSISFQSAEYYKSSRNEKANEFREWYKRLRE